MSEEKENQARKYDRLGMRISVEMIGKWVDAFAPCEARDRHLIQIDTWGHLAPEPQKVYQGYIIFALGAFGDQMPVDVHFEGLPDSPWFFQDMTDYIGKLNDRLCAKARVRSVCGVWRFEGKYRKFKNGHGMFGGKVTPINCGPVEKPDVAKLDDWEVEDLLERSRQKAEDA